MDSVITVACSVLAGIILLLAGRLLGILVFDPWQEQRKAIGEVDYYLLYLANVYGNPTSTTRAKTLPPGAFERIRDDGFAIRKCASRLIANTNAIMGYGMLGLLPRVPSYTDVQQAVGNLIHISNAVFDDDHGAGRYNRKMADEVRALLCLTRPVNEPRIDVAAPSKAERPSAVG